MRLGPIRKLFRWLWSRNQARRGMTAREIQGMAITSVVCGVHFADVLRQRCLASQAGVPLDEWVTIKNVVAELWHWLVTVTYDPGRDAFVEIMVERLVEGAGREIEATGAP